MSAEERNARRAAAFREVVREHKLNADDVALLYVLGNRPGFSLNTSNHLAGDRAATARRLRRKRLLASGGLGVTLTRTGLGVAHIVCAVGAEDRKLA